MNYFWCFLLIASLNILDANCAKQEWIKSFIQVTPDFPIKGVDFLWYGSLLKDPKAFKSVIQIFASRYKEAQIDAVVALESRGFIFGSALAYELEVPLVLIRKKGKLPREVYSVSYGLHYGKDVFELEKSSLNPGQKVLIIDDVLATGGTSRAAAALVNQAGAEVYEAAFLIEIVNLKGREISPFPVFSQLELEGN